MATDIVVGREIPLPGPHHDQAFSGNLQHEVITRLGQLLFTAGAEPLPAEDPLLLLPEDLG
jgi:hypothetical protein